MTDRPGEDNLLPPLEPSPTFAPGVMMRIAEIERLRGVERAQPPRTRRFLAACMAWALLLGWLVTGLLVPPLAALCYTLGCGLALLADATARVGVGAGVALAAGLAALLIGWQAVAGRQRRDWTPGA
jgi:hypothetical protein